MSVRGRRGGEKVIDRTMPRGDSADLGEARTDRARDSVEKRMGVLFFALARTLATRGLTRGDARSLAYGGRVSSFRMVYDQPWAICPGRRRSYLHLNWRTRLVYPLQA